jgi:hypothetical protein
MNHHENDQIVGEQIQAMQCYQRATDSKSHTSEMTYIHGTVNMPKQPVLNEAEGKEQYCVEISNRKIILQ